MISTNTETIRVAVGPVMRGWGSWEWLGHYFLESLPEPYEPVAFAPWEPVEADLIILIKHRPPAAWFERTARHARVVYCPVDLYGSVEEIRHDGPWLASCARVVAHCRRLVPWFRPFCRTDYADHPIHHAVPPRSERTHDGSVLWVGVRPNLPPLLEELARRPLKEPLEILTDAAPDGSLPDPAEWGASVAPQVRVTAWSPDEHLHALARARAAIDWKGGDFRSHHKPPAKAFDFLASGLPLAMNPDSSAVEELRQQYDFRIVSPGSAAWLTEGYWRDTQRVARAIRERLSGDVLIRHYVRLFKDVLSHGPELGDSLEHHRGLELDACGTVLRAEADPHVHKSEA